MLSAGRFAAGVGALFLMLGPVVWGATRLRARFLGAVSGAEARLAEAVGSIAIVLAVAHVLGAVGAFRLGPLVAACALSGVAIALASGRPKTTIRVDVAGPSRVEGVAIVLAAALAVAAWAPPTITALSEGITHYDSLWYHLPHAARFFQDGWLTRLHFTIAEFPDTFHPADVETLHAVGMLLFARDLLSPVLNLGWLALALLAGWCVGASKGRGPWTLLVAAVFLGSPIVSREGGTASNDLAAIALVLSACALLLSAPITPPRAAFAGLAAGVAVGSKLTAAVAVVALSVGAVIVSERRHRLVSTLAWWGSLLFAGGYWYLRNLFRAGSPHPALPLGIGPLAFPRARFDFIERYGGSVSDYVFDAGIWRRYFFPGLADSFGPLWPALVAAAIAAAVWALVRGPSGAIRVLGATSLVSGAAYVVTPMSATGGSGDPFLFSHAVLYAGPALLVGITLVPMVLKTFGQVTRWTLLLASLALVAQAHLSGHSTWHGGRTRWAVAAAIVTLAGAAVGFAVSLMRDRRVVLGVVAVGLTATIAVFFPIADRYLERRYLHAPTVRSATVGGTRVAIAGMDQQYPLYDNALRTHVQYVGDRDRHGAFHRSTTCEAWRASLRRGRYDRVVLAPSRFGTQDRELAWTRSDPAARLIRRLDQVSVFAFDPTVASAGCDERR